MANIVKDNPMVLDTASTSAVIGNVHGRIIRGVRWVKGTTAGHEMILKDGNAKILYHMVATAANYDEESQIQTDAHEGLIMHTLTSGILYVYFK